MEVDGSCCSGFCSRFTRRAYEVDFRSHRVRLVLLVSQFYRAARENPRCSFWLMNYTLAASAQIWTPGFRMVPLLFYKPCSLRSITTLLQDNQRFSYLSKLSNNVWKWSPAKKQRVSFYQSSKWCLNNLFSRSWWLCCFCLCFSLAWHFLNQLQNYIWKQCPFLPSLSTLTMFWPFI